MFTPGSVTNIEIYIDEIHAGKAVHSEGPLYVLPWKPDLYKTGLHSIRVVVQVHTIYLLFFVHHKLFITLLLGS